MMMIDTNIAGEFFLVITIVNSILQLLGSFSRYEWGGTSSANWAKLPLNITLLLVLPQITRHAICSSVPPLVNP